MIVSGAFIAASLLVIVAPGPDLALISSHVLRYGPRSGFVTGAGIMTGGALHALLSMTGVSVLLGASPAWHSSLRWAGGAALCAKGTHAWWLTARARKRGGGASRTGIPTSAPAPGAVPLLPRQTAPPLRSAYLTGLGCNILNVKVLLFLAAFLPQFVPGKPTPSALALLAAVYLGMALCWIGVAIGLVCWMRTRLVSSSLLGHVERLAAAVLIVLGVHLVLAA
jgi:threonine/homoserine/homoserine lactone efflux protein